MFAKPSGPCAHETSQAQRLPMLRVQPTSPPATPTHPTVTIGKGPALDLHQLPHLKHTRSPWVRKSRNDRASRKSFFNSIRRLVLGRLSRCARGVDTARSLRLLPTTDPAQLSGARQRVVAQPRTPPTRDAHQHRSPLTRRSARGACRSVLGCPLPATHIAALDPWNLS